MKYDARACQFNMDTGAAKSGRKIRIPCYIRRKGAEVFCPALVGYCQYLLRLGKRTCEISVGFFRGGHFKKRIGNKHWQIGKNGYNKITENASVQQEDNFQISHEAALYAYNYYQKWLAYGSIYLTDYETTLWNLFEQAS